jgi:large subunit ribosomal protein L15
MPLYRRIPKRGFKNRNTKEIIAINVSVLEKKFENGDTVTVESLIEKGIIGNINSGIQNVDGVKILGQGELTKKLTVKVNAFSESAKEKIEAAGGTAEVI